FPELVKFAQNLPNGTVLDGEILPFKDDKPLSFGILQTRIGRKNISKKHLQDAPVSFMAYDVLEWQGRDCRQRPLSERRMILEKLQKQLGANNPEFLISTVVQFSEWEELTASRNKSRKMLDRKSTRLNSSHVKISYA